MSLTNHHVFPLKQIPTGMVRAITDAVVTTIRPAITAVQRLSLMVLGMRTALSHRQCPRTHSHGRHFGQVGAGVRAVPGPRRFSRVLDGRGPPRRRRRAAQSHPAQRRQVRARGPRLHAHPLRQHRPRPRQLRRRHGRWPHGDAIEHADDPVLQQRRNGPVAPPIRTGRARA